MFTDFGKQYGAMLLKALYFLILALAACSGGSTPAAARNFNVAVIVDTTSDPVTREQAEAVIAIANEKLLGLAGFGLQLVEFVEDDSGHSVDRLVEDFMSHRESTLPNGILIFSVGDEDRAKIHRAYARQIAAPDGFRNAFVSPHLGAGYMYVGILQFNHHYAACGYGSADTIQSPVSIDGECRGIHGVPCAKWNGLSVCESALDMLEGHTPIDMTTGPLIHEFMHAFSDRGPEDHYASGTCNKVMGKEANHFDFAESEYFNGICPDVYTNFADSYQP